MSTLNLLSDFPAVSTEAWEQAIRDDLKGEDCAQLLCHLDEGFDVKPYYRAEDLAGLKFLDAAPGDFPYLRGTRSRADWRIREEIDTADPEEANRAACSAVAAGGEEIAFSNPRIANASDLGMLMANLEEIPICFEYIDSRALHLLMERLNRRQTQAEISALIDWSADADFAAEVVAASPQRFVPITIGGEFQNRGATAVEEVGFALASGVDFLAAMQDRDVPVDRAAEAITFSFAMGPDFLLQMAKLRAFRMLWAQAVEQFNGACEHAKARVYARTSRWNRTLYDPQMNALRGTTEALSAILGGAESILVAPFDDCYKAPDEASRRLARNTQIILRQEALLARVADPGGGSYCLEVLTNSIAEAGWKVLKEIEVEGGYRNAASRIARQLAEREAALRKGVESRRRVLVGTNRYADASEPAFDRIEVARHAASSGAALSFERMRLRAERHAMNSDKTPRVLLAEIGDAKASAARSSFAADALACAGLSAEIQRFERTEQIAASDADLIVLCSSDPEYLPLATELMAALHARGSTVPVVVAGNPETAQQLQAAGIAEFIHIRSNLVDVLSQLQQRLGIEDK